MIKLIPFLMLNFLIFMPVLHFSAELLSKESEVFIEQGFMWSKKKKLETIPATYSVRSQEMFDKEEQKYFVIMFNKGVDYLLYFDKKALETLLESIQTFKDERLALLKAKSYTSLSLGSFDIPYIEESTFGTGIEIAENPMLNYNVHHNDIVFYLELVSDPIKSRGKREIDPKPIYLSDSQIEIMYNFIHDNNLVETID